MVTILSWNYNFAIIILLMLATVRALGYNDHRFYFQLTEKNVDISTKARTYANAQLVTSLKQPEQKWHGGILPGVDSDVKVIPLYSLFHYKAAIKEIPSWGKESSVCAACS